MTHPQLGGEATLADGQAMAGPPPAPSPAAAARTARLTVLVTSVAYLMVTLDALVVVTALPSIHADLGGGGNALPWIVNAYTLSFAAGIIAATVAGDRLGRRRLYRVGLTLFAAASAACALAPGLGALVAFRALQGCGAAILAPLGLTLLTSAFPPERRGAVVGIWGGVAGLGVAAGPLVGGGVTEGLDWHWVFWVNVPIGLLAALAAGRVLPADSTSGEPRPRLDLVGLVLATSGIGLLVWGLLQGPAEGWASTRTLTPLSVAAVLVAGFVAWERRVATPLVPPALFRSGAFTASVATTFLMGGAIFSAAYLTSQFFQVGLGDTPLGTGARFLPWTVTPLLVAPVAGQLMGRVGARGLAATGLVAQAGGFLWIAQLAQAHAGYPAYVAPFVLAGVGVSMALPAPSTTGLNAAPPALLGRAAGVLNTTQQIGATVAIALVTVVFDSAGSLASPAATTAGYHPALLVAAALSTAGAVSALGLRPGRRTEAPAGAAARA
jgi:EmrB/QacA subfamily drug resistance transporter